MRLRKLSGKSFPVVKWFVLIAMLVVLHAGVTPSVAAPQWLEEVNAVIAELEARVSALEATSQLKVHGGIQYPSVNDLSQVTISFDGAGFTASPVLSASAAILSGPSASKAGRVIVIAISASSVTLEIKVINPNNNATDSLDLGTLVQISYMALGY